jgi:hypothetical protein
MTSGTGPQGFVEGSTGKFRYVVNRSREIL